MSGHRRRISFVATTFIPLRSDILVFNDENIERMFNRYWNRFKKGNADFKSRTLISRTSNNLIRVSMRCGFYAAMLIVRGMVETGKIRGIRE